MIFLNFQLEKEKKEEKAGGVGFHVKNYGFDK
jgi:hypothetical protein